MELKFGWKYALAFLALNGVVSELHEQAHITTGRLLAGCYGPRDFNVWQACADHPSPVPWAASVAGPLFSYAVMWLGVWLLWRGAQVAHRAVGLALVFAPLPFARVFTALVGGGDEKTFLTYWLDNPGLGRAGAIALTLVACGLPVFYAWRALANRHRGWIVAGLCVLPMLAVYAYKIKFLNSLLLQGRWDAPPILGTPPMVLAVFALMVLATAATWRWLLPAR
ncbi:MAG TPA: hypothetical protein VFF16_07820 [Telluria sp.]|nr:hypothetical protein [Telluria sp.]